MHITSHDIKKFGTLFTEYVIYEDVAFGIVARGRDEMKKLNCQRRSFCRRHYLSAFGGRQVLLFGVFAGQIHAPDCWLESVGADDGAARD